MLFRIPAGFATPFSPYSEWEPCDSAGAMNGGFVMLRPCPAIFHHMKELLDNDEELQYRLDVSSGCKCGCP